MYQLLNFIRFDLWIPKKIVYENFEKNILEKLNEFEDEKGKKKKDENKEENDDEINKINLMKNKYTYNAGDGYYYLNKKLTIDDKEEIRQIFLELGKKDILPVLIWIVFCIVGCVLLFYLIYLRINIIRIFLIFVIFGLGLLYAFTINKYISERIHLIYFGIIGFLFTKDNFDEIGLWTVVYTMLWAMIIAALDELFQLFLPYRVGDVRDIIFGVLGGLWGGMIYSVLNFKSLIKRNN